MKKLDEGKTMFPVVWVALFISYIALTVCLVLLICTIETLDWLKVRVEKAMEWIESTLNPYIF